MAKNKKEPGFTFKTAYDYAMINQATWTPMIGMVMSSNNDVSEDIKQARQAKLVLRSKFALEDAVKKLEVLQPSWIPSVEVNGA
uniref:Uncharacterized protein n=1 Tax=Acrobeloides nanus TaxID=290746 RepID=A0A914C804_9BILA